MDPCRPIVTIPEQVMVVIDHKLEQTTSSGVVGVNHEWDQDK